MQSATGLRQSGHMRPLSVEYTSPPREERDFMLLMAAFSCIDQCYIFDSYLRTFHAGYVPK